MSPRSCCWQSYQSLLAPRQYLRSGMHVSTPRPAQQVISRTTHAPGPLSIEDGMPFTTAARQTWKAVFDCVGTCKLSLSCQDVLQHSKLFPQTVPILYAHCMLTTNSLCLSSYITSSDSQSMIRKMHESETPGAIAQPYRWAAMNTPVWLTTPMFSRERFRLP